MIINDRFRFVFVHIPKCGGTSVRNALSRFDDRNSFYFLRALSDHKEIGRLDYAHIPLKLLESYFKDDFECVKKYSGFAVFRDPYARFPSSLAQRLMMFKGQKLELLSRGEVKREIDEVIKYITHESPYVPITNPEFIHFSRQIDYVEIDGNRLIERIYPIEHIDDLLSDIESITGVRINKTARIGERLTYKIKGLETVADLVQRSLISILPRYAWRPVFSFAKQALNFSNLLDRSPRAHGELFDSKYVSEFISDFYKGDFAIYGKINAEQKIGAQD